MEPPTLPTRRGPRPETTRGNPHMQLDQQSSLELVLELARRCFSLPGVEERPTLISVPSARALWLRDNLAKGPVEAFLVAREFAHIHPLPDGSLHAALPMPIAQQAVVAGWAEPHPLGLFGLVPPTVVMLYAPRDADELRVICELVDLSRRFAHGEQI